MIYININFFYSDLDVAWDICLKVTHQTREKIIKKIKNPQIIMDNLADSYLIYDLMWHEFLSREKIAEQNSYLLEIMPRVGPTALDVMIETLRRSKQINAYSDLNTVKRNLQDEHRRICEIEESKPSKWNKLVIKKKFFSAFNIFIYNFLLIMMLIR